ncbi:hydroxymethylbilane synthase [Antricoccus suffuscus]|uniref:Porphobilinogen deaminase n=1 Tax=Antricoccus suffuscus TaxID=1629062 RepID=A0A2T0ZRX3_9ACTN|nr:hydroxymethylbilane synthase [Antricoccus suffuscus]PRZ39075.1 hydroxymethylbilane synthase [Antricoccus suffuscus]
MNHTSTDRALRLGTRASRLARGQSQQVADLLCELTGRAVELVDIATKGDATTAPLHTLGGQGVFTSALREALLDGQIDFAVHSLKDLPTAPADGLTLAAIPERVDPRDALVARDGLTLAELPTGSRVGTGSLRRSAQIRALGLGVELVGMRGNVDTRLSKVTSGELDAVVLACAGLHRIGRSDAITEALDPIAILPAPGQGALAIEARSDDPATLDLLKPLDHHYSRISVTAERALLATLEAGCSSPVGALAEVVEAENGLEISLRGSVTAIDGSDSVRLSATGPLTDAVGVGERLARILLDDGAAELMGSSR